MLRAEFAAKRHLILNRAMCSTHIQLRDTASAFIKHEDWVAHLECSALNYDRGKGGNKSDLKSGPVPFFTPSFSSAPSSASYGRAQFQSQSKSLISHDTHFIGWTNSSTYEHSRNQNPIATSDASCRYSMVCMSIKIKCFSIQQKPKRINCIIQYKCFPSFIFQLFSF